MNIKFILFNNFFICLDLVLSEQQARMNTGVVAGRFLLNQAAYQEIEKCDLEDKESVEQ